MIFKLISVIITIVSASKIPNINEDTYLLVTALFYTDVHGRTLLVPGPLPSEVDNTIKNDLQNRLPEHRPNLNVTVVPAFQDYTDIPIHENVLEHLKSLHPHVFMVDLTQIQSKKILENMEKIMHRRQNYTQTNDVAEKVTAASGQSTEWTTEGYVPNDIYYGVEKKCAKGCDKAASLLIMPAKYLKVKIAEYIRNELN